jgi:hypothetical protein
MSRNDFSSIDGGQYSNKKTETVNNQRAFFGSHTRSIQQFPDAVSVNASQQAL